jgi:RNA polymerase sigma factor (sigma-70 family)
MSEPLLSRLRARDPRAQAECRRQYLPALEAVCARALSDPHSGREVAEEVLADVMLSHVDRLREERALPAYLRMIAVRRCARLKARSQRTEELSEELPDESSGPESAILAAEQQHRLGRCLGRLRPRVQHWLRLRFHEGMTQEAIGAAFDCSKQYVGRLLAQALAELKQCVEAADE